MSADTLSDLLRAVRLRGAIFFYVEGANPWVAETPQSREIIPAILPGVDHMMEFHVVVRGSCWAAIVGEEPVLLNEGDIVLFPQGDHHVISSAPGLRVKALDPGIFFAPKPAQLPFSIRVNGHGPMRPNPTTTTRDHRAPRRRRARPDHRRVRVPRLRHPSVQPVDRVDAAGLAHAGARA